MLKQEDECIYWIDLVPDRTHQWQLDDSGDDISSSIKDEEVFGSLGDTEFQDERLFRYIDDRHYSYVFR